MTYELIYPVTGFPLAKLRSDVHWLGAIKQLSLISLFGFI
jgi:hypothetical protein